MSFLELAKRRASIRGYQPEPVSDRDIETILEAGRLAPSAANFQPWHFIVVKDEATRRALKPVYNKDWFWKAPVILVVCVEPRKAWSRQDGRNYAWVDGSIAMDHMTLCAADLGLGTCWIGAFDPSKVREALNIPADVEPVAMTPLGKPSATPLPKKRKDLKEIVHREKW